MKHKYYIDYFNKLKFLKFNFMQEFLESDAIWAFLLNAVGLISFGVGFWLIYKLVIFSINLRKNKKKNFNNYINLLKLPDRFQGLTQIGIQSNIQQNIDFKILDSNEKVLNTIFNEKIEKGEKILVFDSSKYKNGEYYILISTSYQSILRKIVVDN